MPPEKSTWFQCKRFVHFYFSSFIAVIFSSRFSLTQTLSIRWLASNIIYKSVLHLRPHSKTITQWCCTYSHPLFVLKPKSKRWKERENERKTVPSIKYFSHFNQSLFFFGLLLLLRPKGSWQFSQMQISDGWLFVAIVTIIELRNDSRVC